MAKSKQQARKGKQRNKGPPEKVTNKGRGGKKTGTPAKKGSQIKGKKKQQQLDRARRKREERKPKTAEELEAEMDDYWLKSKNPEVAGKKLDEEMDEYWNKKAAATEEAATEEAAAEGEAAAAAPEEATEE